jgi:hypothetical protein
MKVMCGRLPLHVVLMAIGHGLAGASDVGMLQPQKSAEDQLEVVDDPLVLGLDEGVDGDCGKAVARDDTLGACIRRLNAACSPDDN